MQNENVYKSVHKNVYENVYKSAHENVYENVCKPVHENAIEKPASAVEDRTDRPDKGQEMIVRDEALAERFVEAGHRLSYQDSAKPERRQVVVGKLEKGEL